MLWFFSPPSTVSSDPVTVNKQNSPVVVLDLQDQCGDVSWAGFNELLELKTVSYCIHKWFLCFSSAKSITMSVQNVLPQQYRTERMPNAIVWLNMWLNFHWGMREGDETFIIPITTTSSFSVPVLEPSSQANNRRGKYCKYFYQSAFILGWFSIIETTFGTDILYITNTAVPFFKKKKKENICIVHVHRAEIQHQQTFDSHPVQSPVQVCGR